MPSSSSIHPTTPTAKLSRSAFTFAQPPISWVPTSSPSSPATLRTVRYWRSYLSGVTSLQAEPDKETWLDFLSCPDALGPFEELLNEGLVPQALSIYRAHEPYSEANPDRVPHILKTSLPRVLSKSRDALPSLLSWTSSLQLTDPHSIALMSSLVSSAAKHLARASQLSLALEVARGAPPNCADATLLAQLERQIHLRDAHGVTECRDGADPVVLMLLRCSDEDVSPEIDKHVRPWTAHENERLDAALLRALPSLPLAKQLAVTARLSDEQAQTEALLLVLRATRPPFPPQLQRFIETHSCNEQVRQAAWALRCRTIALKYAPAAADFDPTHSAHVRALADEILSRAVDADEALWADAWEVTPGFERRRLGADLLFWASQRGAVTPKQAAALVGLVRRKQPAALREARLVLQGLPEGRPLLSAMGVDAELGPPSPPPAEPTSAAAQSSLQAQLVRRADEWDLPRHVELLSWLHVASDALSPPPAPERFRDRPNALKASHVLARKMAELVQRRGDAVADGVARHLLDNGAPQLALRVQAATLSAHAGRTLAQLAEQGQALARSDKDVVLVRAYCAHAGVDCTLQSEDEALASNPARALARLLLRSPPPSEEQWAHVAARADFAALQRAVEQLDGRDYERLAVGLAWLLRCAPPAAQPRVLRLAQLLEVLATMPARASLWDALADCTKLFPAPFALVARAARLCDDPERQVARCLVRHALESACSWGFCARMLEGLKQADVVDQAAEQLKLRFPLEARALLARSGDERRVAEFMRQRCLCAVEGLKPEYAAMWARPDALVLQLYKDRVPQVHAVASKVMDDKDLVLLLQKAVLKWLLEDAQQDMAQAQSLDAPSPCELFFLREQAQAELCALGLGHELIGLERARKFLADVVTQTVKPVSQQSKARALRALRLLQREVDAEELALQARLALAEQGKLTVTKQMLQVTDKGSIVRGLLHNSASIVALSLAAGLCADFDLDELWDDVLGAQLGAGAVRDALTTLEAAPPWLVAEMRWRGVLLSGGGGGGGADLGERVCVLIERCPFDQVVRDVGMSWAGRLGGHVNEERLAAAVARVGQ